jgi:hypothetical protein
MQKDKEQEQKEMREKLECLYERHRDDADRWSSFASSYLGEPFETREILLKALKIIDNMGQQQKEKQHKLKAHD